MCCSVLQCVAVCCSVLQCSLGVITMSYSYNLPHPLLTHVSACVHVCDCVCVRCFFVICSLFVRASVCRKKGSRRNKHAATIQLVRSSHPVRACNARFFSLLLSNFLPRSTHSDSPLPFDSLSLTLRTSLSDSLRLNSRVKCSVLFPFLSHRG